MRAWHEREGSVFEGRGAGVGVDTPMHTTFKSLSKLQINRLTKQGGKPKEISKPSIECLVNIFNSSEGL